MTDEVERARARLRELAENAADFVLEQQVLAQEWYARTGFNAEHCLPRRQRRPQSGLALNRPEVQRAAVLALYEALMAAQPQMGAIWWGRVPGCVRVAGGCSELLAIQRLVRGVAAKLRQENVHGLVLPGFTVPARGRSVTHSKLMIHARVICWCAPREQAAVQAIVERLFDRSNCPACDASSISARPPTADMMERTSHLANPWPFFAERDCKGCNQNRAASRTDKLEPGVIDSAREALSGLTVTRASRGVGQGRAVRREWLMRLRLRARSVWRGTCG